MINNNLLQAFANYKKDRISAKVNFISLFGGRHTSNSYCVDADLILVSPSRSCIKLTYTLLFYMFLSNNLSNNKGSSLNFIRNNDIECDSSFFFLKENKEMIVIVHYNSFSFKELNEEYKYLIYDSIKESFDKAVVEFTKTDILDSVLSNLPEKHYTF